MGTEKNDNDALPISLGRVIGCLWVLLHFSYSSIPVVPETYKDYAGNTKL